MKKSIVLILTLTSVILIDVAKAQDPTYDQGCTGPVYSGKELSRRVKITSYPPPDMPSDKRAKEVEGRVVLYVVACHTGRITNIRVVEKLPYGLTEEAIKAARKVKFRPAEKHGQAVSQYTSFEYTFRRT
jgi:TonB family protein